MRDRHLYVNISPRWLSLPVDILRSLLEYGIAIILLIQCNTMWMTLDPIRDTIGLDLYKWLIFCIAGCMLLSVGRVTTKRLASGAIILSVLALYLFVLYKNIKTNADVYYTFAYVLLVIAVYFLTCYDGGVSKILIKYKSLICIVAIYSLIMWLLCTVLERIPYTDMEMTSWNDTSFQDVPVKSWYGIYFEPHVKRNSSIFAEPPMAALHYSIAMLIEVLLKKKPSPILLCILSAAILSTASTMGYLVILYLVLMFTVSWLWKKGWLKKWYVIIGMVAVVCAVAYLAYDIFIEKTETVSYSIRYDDIKAGWQAFKDAPLFGNGCNNLPAIQQYMSKFRYFNMGYSSGLLWILSDGGLWLGAIYIVPVLVATAKGILYKKWGISVFALSILAIFVITVFQYTYLLSFISMFLLFYRPEKNVIDEIKEQSE